MAGDRLLVTPIDPDGLNVRNGPGADRAAVASAFIGEPLEVLEARDEGKKKIGQAGEWLHIRTPKNDEGYVAAEFVRRAYVTPPGDAPPVPEDVETANPRLITSATTVDEPVPANEQKNLLTNPMFDDATYEQVADGSTNIPRGWKAWWEQPVVNDCYNFKPNFGRLTKQQAPERVRAGNHVAFYYSPWSSHHAGYLQTIPVEKGATYQFSIWGHAWSSGGEPKSTATSKLWVGIDPAGGEDPLGGSVLWGPEVVAMDTAHEFVLEAKAQGDRLTVFTRSRPDWCMQHNNVFWDDARLTAIARPVSGSGKKENNVESGAGGSPVQPPTLTVESGEPLMLRTMEADGLRIRSGPGTEHDRLSAIGPWDRVEAVNPNEARNKLGEQDQWIEVRTKSGETGWAAAWFMEEAPKTYVFPFGHAIAGLHGPADPAAWAWTQDTYNLIRETDVKAVKVLAAGDIGEEQVNHLRGLGVEFIMARLFAKFASRRTPDEFFEEVRGATDRLYQAGVRWFEVHNEPNLHHKDGPEGMWVMWQNGGEFSGFFHKMLELLRNRYPDAMFGWPGLSPGFDFSHDGKQIRYDSARFEAEAQDAMEAADFICIHTYWGADGSPYTRSLDDLRRYAEWFPDKGIIASEFSNSSPSIDKRVKGEEYVHFYREAKNLPENVGALFSYIISASWGYTAETWKDSPIPGLVARR